MIHHPDRNKGDEVRAAEKFTIVKTAFEILSNGGMQVLRAGSYFSSNGNKSQPMMISGPYVPQKKKDKDESYVLGRASLARERVWAFGILGKKWKEKVLVMNNGLKVIGGLAFTSLISSIVKTGSQNQKYKEVTWDELNSIKLKPNQFWHGISVIPVTEYSGRMSEQDKTKKSLEFLDSSGYTVSRHSEHGVKRQQGLTPDDGTYMSKRASYVSEYAEPFFAILENSGR